jgi:hypothetical protein
MTTASGPHRCERLRACRSKIDWVFQIPPRRDLASGFTPNDWGTSCPCLLPPLTVKDTPPAVRAVVGSWLRLEQGDKNVKQNTGTFPCYLKKNMVA